MKKKISKKLALSKETLRNLEVVDLKQVAGGMTVISGCDFCTDPSCGSCMSCYNTCAC